MRSEARCISALKKSLTKARAAAFAQAAVDRPRRTGRARAMAGLLALEQVTEALKLSSSLPRHELALDELVFDNLFLHLSREYRKTRLLARALGSALAPAKVTRKRAYREWDPGHPLIEYSPIESELARALTEAGSTPTQRWAGLLRLRKKITSVYHESSHHIVFSLLEPVDAPKTRYAARQYYSLVESLVRLRDLALAEELGALGSPFLTAAALNFSMPAGSAPRSSPLTFEEFSRRLSYLVLQTLGLTHAQIARKLRDLGLPCIGHSYFDKHTSYSNQVQERWFSWYFKKHGAEIRRPRLRNQRRRAEAPSLRLSERDLMETIVSPASMRELYEWYQSVFYRRSAQRRTRTQRDGGKASASARPVNRKAPGFARSKSKSRTRAESRSSR